MGTDIGHLREEIGVSVLGWIAVVAYVTLCLVAGGLCVAIILAIEHPDD